MKHSARNIFRGTVTNVNEGAVNGIVTIDVNGTPVCSTISINAINELGLKEGKDAYAVVKATEVMIGIGEMKLSARNKFPGTVTEIEEGAVNGIVRMDVLGGNKLSATISMNAIKELGLSVGCEAVAVIKATSVMVGID